MPNWLETAKRWIFGLWCSTTDDKSTISSKARHPLPLHFNTVEVVDKTPSNASIENKQFVEVVYKNVPRWVLFRCPCGCGEMISLSLQKEHNPSWKLRTDALNHPTLWPSIWRNKGCMSHFWVKNGRIHWCADSGAEPWKMRSDLYQKPG